MACSNSAMLRRVRVAMICATAGKFVQANVTLSKHCPTGSQCLATSNERATVWVPGNGADRARPWLCSPVPRNLEARGRHPRVTHVLCATNWLKTEHNRGIWWPCLHRDGVSITTIRRLDRDADRDEVSR